MELSCYLCQQIASIDYGSAVWHIYVFYKNSMHKVAHTCKRARLPRKLICTLTMKKDPKHQKCNPVVIC